jgi:hypothetical protein
MSSCLHQLQNHPNHNQRQTLLDTRPCPLSNASFASYPFSFSSKTAMARTLGHRIQAIVTDKGTAQSWIPKY